MEGTSHGGSKRRRLNALAWRDLLKRFDAAGATVEQFCQAEGLSRSSFNRWRSRLQARPGRAVLGQPDRADKASSPSLSPSQSLSPFVDLGLLGAPTAMTPTASPVMSLPAPLDLRLDLGGGIVLHLQRR
jgi:hypothetical protein